MNATFSYERLEEQFERFRRSGIFSRSQHQLPMLRYLLRQDTLNHFDDGDLVAEDVGGEFYSKGKRRRKTREDVAEAAKKVVAGLRKHLEDYYERHATDPGPLHIWIPVGTFRPECVPTSRDRQASTAPIESDLVLNDWDNEYFHRVLSTTECTADEEEDLRIWTTAFNTGGFWFDDLEALVRRKHIRIKVIMIDPERVDLITARNKLREDRGPEKALQEIQTQINAFGDRIRFPHPSEAKANEGTFELKLSDALPFGFVMHRRDTALIGLLWAHSSFAERQMIEVDSRTSLWRTLKEDWNVRWKAAWQPGKRPISKEDCENLTVADIDEFFGDGAALRSDSAEIILQDDQITNIVQLNKDIDSQDRAYKARVWLNRWDYSGCKAIQQEFRSHCLGEPRIVLARRNDLDNDTAPFQISMGLGFTTATTNRVGNVCNTWMRISYGREGDSVCFHKDIEDFDTNRCIPADDHPGFRRWLPQWDAEIARRTYGVGEYIEAWLLNEDGSNKAPDVPDYAVILRHTEMTKGIRHCHFVLAGFTERGTAIAGLYLARNWPMLLVEFVKGRVRSASRGDFMALVEGPSNPSRCEEWRIAGSITPEKLSKIPCVWSRRKALG